MHGATRSLVLFAVSVALSVQPILAFAAPATWKSVDVTLQPEQQQSMLLVSGELPPEVKLPVEAELAVPAGTQLQWIGEILGGDPAKDPTLSYTKSSTDGVDVYRFTLTKSRVAQVEGIAANGPSFDGTNYVTGFKWVAWQAVPEVRISQRIPQGSQIAQAAPGASIQPGGTGYSYYTKTLTAPKAGDVIDLSFSYTLPVAGAATTSSGAGSSSDTFVFMLIVIIFIGGFVLMVVNINKKLAAKAAVGKPATARSSAQPTKQPTSAETPRTQRRKPAAEPIVQPVAPKKMKPIIPAVIIIGGILFAFAFAGAKGTTAANLNGTLTRDFGAPSACQSASIAFTPNQGVDLSRQGGKLLEGFEGMEGVGEITIDLAQSKIDLAWCESSQTEESLRQVLSAAGLVTLGQGTPTAASAPTSATVDSSGDMQTATVDTSSGSFAPTQLVLQAGIPAELSFGPAVGCLSEVVINDLGITQDLTKGPATVKLPALEAGSYAFACAMGHQSGEIVVQ